jgi:hypothetical protein
MRGRPMVGLYKLLVNFFCVFKERKTFDGVIQIIGEFLVFLKKGRLMVWLYKLLVKRLGAKKKLQWENKNIYY